MICFGFFSNIQHNNSITGPSQEGGWGAVAAPVFSRTVNPISTRGAHYPHPVLLALLDFQTLRRPWYVLRNKMEFQKWHVQHWAISMFLYCSKKIWNVAMYIKHRSLKKFDSVLCKWLLMLKWRKISRCIWRIITHLYGNVLCRAVGSGGSFFDRTVNPILKSGADYAHHGTKYLATALICMPYLWNLPFYKF